jgi:hypothetical protein
MGLGFFRPKSDGWAHYTPPVGSRIVEREHDLLVMPTAYAAAVGMAT